MPSIGTMQSGQVASIWFGKKPDSEGGVFNNKQWSRPMPLLTQPLDSPLIKCPTPRTLTFAKHTPAGFIAGKNRTPSYPVSNLDAMGYDWLSRQNPMRTNVRCDTAGRGRRKRRATRWSSTTRSPRPPSRASPSSAASSPRPAPRSTRKASTLSGRGRGVQRVLLFGDGCTNLSSLVTDMWGKNENETHVWFKYGDTSNECQALKTFFVQSTLSLFPSYFLTTLRFCLTLAVHW